MAETTLRDRRNAETAAGSRAGRAQLSDIFWRRRVAALLISLSVLGALTWTTADLLGGPAPPARTAAAGRSHLARGAGQQIWPVDPAPTSGLTAAAVDGSRATPVRHGMPACPAADLRVSLTASQASYSVWEQPEFAVSVTSTASYQCSLDVGAQHVLLQIRAGSAQVWTSAECAEGQASQVIAVRAHAPAALTMTWDEQFSSPGCPVPGRASRAGSYTAIATDGAAVSGPVVFRLS